MPFRLYLRRRTTVFYLARKGIHNKVSGENVAGTRKRLFKVIIEHGKLFELCYNETTSQQIAVELIS